MKSETSTFQFCETIIRQSESIYMGSNDGIEEEYSERGYCTSAETVMIHWSEYVYMSDIYIYIYIIYCL